jgi:hypothetical protein
MTKTEQILEKLDKNAEKSLCKTEFVMKDFLPSYKIKG